MNRKEIVGGVFTAVVAVLFVNAHCANAEAFPAGRIRATLRDRSGSPAADAATTFYISSFEPDKVATGNPGTFTNVPAGQSCEVEGWQTGPAPDHEEEYWGSAMSPTVASNGTSEVVVGLALVKRK